MTSSVLLVCIFAPGHSKGGDDVILYASKYGDVPIVVNISGRFWLDRGVAQRFGQDYMQRLQDGPIPITSKLDDGSKFTWQLTKQVRQCT